MNRVGKIAFWSVALAFYILLALLAIGCAKTPPRVAPPDAGSADASEDWCDLRSRCAALILFACDCDETLAISKDCDPHARCERATVWADERRECIVPSSCEGIEHLW